MSRTLAQDLIRNGKVFVKNQGSLVPILKAGELFAEDADLIIQASDLNRFVSRAGVKLELAFLHLQQNIEGFQVLDVGISTGGFTDCLLQRKVAQVVGVDVGRAQVHPQILQDPRVKTFDGVNARHLKSHPEVQAAFPSGGFDLIVMDVSFISMTLILPEVLPYLKSSGFFLGLVKPQFELSPSDLGKGGIVKNSAKYKDVEKKISSFLIQEKMQVMDYFPSELEGKDGNKEFFVWTCPDAAGDKLSKR